MVRVSRVAVVSRRIVRVEFTDKSVREIDLTRYLRGPIFAKIAKDDALFRQVRVDAVSKTLAWPNGADIDPDVLYRNLEPASKSVGVVASRATPAEKLKLSAARLLTVRISQKRKPAPAMKRLLEKALGTLQDLPEVEESLAGATEK